MQLVRFVVTVSVGIWPALSSAEEIVRLPLVETVASLTIPADGKLYFLSFGAHQYAPTRFTVDGQDVANIHEEAPRPIALFQNLYATCWIFPERYFGRSVHLHKPPARDPFWDQLLVVKQGFLSDSPQWQLVEVGDFGSALPKNVREYSLSPEEIRIHHASLTDPVIPEALAHELTWDAIESAALPLDFQKVLLAVPHDSNPAFAYQNGQWFTTWPVSGDTKGMKEDRWFAPAIALGEQLFRPAPLSTKTEFIRTDDGTWIPEWTLSWKCGEAVVRQSLLAFQPPGFQAPAVFVKFNVENPPPGCRLAIATGRRLNAHYWDDKSRERTPVPFFTLKPDCTSHEGRLVDSTDRVLLVSNRAFVQERLGPLEDLLLFDLDAGGSVELCAPQGEALTSNASTRVPTFAEVKKQFQAFWVKHLREGSQVELPSQEWMDRIAAWKSQVKAITRVHYQGRERLSYGAYFYQYYFGIEEAWPVIALAQWNSPAEAKRQAEIMLDKENLDKSNVHHQSRNGAAPWAAAMVARLTDDPQWLAQVAPAMVDCARWTESVRRSDNGQRSPLTQGLLPPHIYGGDVRDPATSLYATAICWKGMYETAEALKLLGNDAQIELGEELDREAQQLRKELFAAMDTVAVDDSGATFVPLALELPSLGGLHEGPYKVLTASRLGNYWNLFAPSLLQLQMVGSAPTSFPDADIMHYMANRGGLWGSLPRFYDGLDAAYAGGIIEHLLHASAVDSRFRPRALAALESYFLHAASRNGYSIPEVAGLFPDRLNSVAYERLVREAPWSFGMYDDQRYLEGHISFTEPLGAGAGQALSLIRNALLVETRDSNGALDGKIVLLPTVPSSWFKQGKIIRLDDFPTEYGMLSLRIQSELEKAGEILATYTFRKHTHQRPDRLKTIRLRLAPSDRPAKEIDLEVQESGEVRFKI